MVKQNARKSVDENALKALEDALRDVDIDEGNSANADSDGDGLLDGEEVAAAIRTPEVSQAASKVSALPAVRAALVDLQRRAARPPDRRRSLVLPHSWMV